MSKPFFPLLHCMRLKCFTTTAVPSSGESENSLVNICKRATEFSLLGLLCVSGVLTLLVFFFFFHVWLADSPKRFWWYHWFCWTLSAVGIFCILLAHDHYTVDVVVAYFITTRLFWWYHTMANQQVSATCGTSYVTPLEFELKWKWSMSSKWAHRFIKWIPKLHRVMYTGRRV